MKNNSIVRTKQKRYSHQFSFLFFWLIGHSDDIVAQYQMGNTIVQLHYIYTIDPTFSPTFFICLFVSLDIFYLKTLTFTFHVIILNYFNLILKVVGSIEEVGALFNFHLGKLTLNNGVNFHCVAILFCSL